MLGGTPSWTAAPPQTFSHWDTPPPPFPEHWVQEQGLYALAGGDLADKAALRRVARHAEEAVPRLAQFLGLPTGKQLRIYLAHSQEQFAELQPGSPESWADATAYPQRALIFLRAPRVRPGTAKPLEQVLDHEITHVLLGQGFHGERVPRWLHEGLAQYAAREYTPELTRQIGRGMLGGNLLELEALVQGFPIDPMRARLAYAQSADLVAFLRNQYGEESLRVLVRQLAGGAPVGAAIRAATGRSILEVDRAWRARLQSSNLWLSPLGDDLIWWGLGGLLLVAGALRVRRRNRRRRAAMEREEEALLALEASWGGSPPFEPWDHPLPPEPAEAGPEDEPAWN